jgi:hypothetical protein
MNKLVVCLMLKNVFSTKLPTIRNSNFPICANCIHFIEDKTNYPYEPAPNDKYARCKLFGQVNIVTGEINYDFASFCREDSKRCGLTGVGFEEKPKVSPVPPT